MDLEKAIKHLEETLDDPTRDWPCAACRAEHEQLMGWLRELQILRAQAEAEKNEPLTLEELRKMDGKPVWVKPLVGWKTEPFWAIVHAPYVSDGRLSNDPERCVLSLGGPGAYWTDWIAYRRKPEDPLC